MRNLLFALFVILFIAGCDNKKPVKQRKPITREQLIAANKMLVSRDSLVISSYVDKAGMSGFMVSPAGMWMKIEEEGQGETIAKGDAVELNYTISLLDSTLFYNSASDGVKHFVAGKGNEVLGLEEAIMNLSKGSKAIVILPPHLAFGLVGDDNKIKGRAILRYDIEIINVVK